MRVQSSQEGLKKSSNSFLLCSFSYSLEGGFYLGTWGTTAMCSQHQWLHFPSGLFRKVHCSGEKDVFLFSNFLDSTGGALGVLPGPRGPPQSRQVGKG